MTKNKAEIINKSVYVRKIFGIDNTKPIDIFEALEKREEFTIVFLPLSKNIRGFSHNEKGHKVIVINANDTKPQKNFSCAHELYHLYFNYNEINKYIVKEEDEKENEKKAEQFAGAFLIPQEALYIYIQDNGINPNNLSQKQLCEMERYFGVSRTALVIKLLEECLINNDIAEQYKKNVKLNAVKNGFDTGYYEQTEDNYNTTGEYIKLAQDLYERGKITKSKLNDYLLDAYRSDLVYNIPKDNNDKN